MPAPHAFYSKMLAERTASRNVFVLFYFILFIYAPPPHRLIPVATDEDVTDDSLATTVLLVTTLPAAKAVLPTSATGSSLSLLEPL
jgi:hypothetical protein